jgi:hypothetical protein
MVGLAAAKLMRQIRISNEVIPGEIKTDLIIQEILGNLESKLKEDETSNIAADCNAYLLSIARILLLKKGQMYGVEVGQSYSTEKEASIDNFLEKRLAFIIENTKREGYNGICMKFGDIASKLNLKFLLYARITKGDKIEYRLIDSQKKYASLFSHMKTYTSLSVLGVSEKT